MALIHNKKGPGLVVSNTDVTNPRPTYKTSNIRTGDSEEAVSL